MNKEGSWKTVFLALVSILILIAGQLISGLVFLLPIKNGIIVSILHTIILFSFDLSLIYILITKIMKLSLDYFRITKIKIEPVWFLSAFLLPLIIIGIFLFLDGEVINNNIVGFDRIDTIIGTILMVGFSAGIIEELVFRGIFMTALEKKFNKTVAIFVPSVLFALLHLLGNPLDFISIIFLIIAGTSVGVLFSLITIQSNSIWNSAFVHSIWNMIIVGKILRIGTENNPSSLYSYVIKSKSFIITGGRFGIEASLISVIGYLIFILVALSLISQAKKDNNNNCQI